MALKHILALDVPDTACENILRIQDASIYATGLDVDCPRLDIYLPGYTVPVYITEGLTPAFTVNLSSVDLGLIPINDPSITDLPDGVYTIRYSVSPNDLVYVQYYHLRTTKTMNAYYKEVCKVQLQACEPTPEQHEKLHDLRYIKMYLDAAKAKAEYCHSPKDAADMLQYAQRLLKKYQTGCCVTCNR
jgi:hypothetical protein